MPSRREGLLMLLIASPMSLLGCTPDPDPQDTEGSTTGGTGSSSGSTGAAESTTSGGSTSTGDDTTSIGTTGGSTTGGSTGDDTTSTSGSSSESSSGGGESTSTGGEQGNTCDRVGHLMDQCYGGGGYYYYGSYYEYACNANINGAIAEGDIECAQAYNEVYACIADLECVQVLSGPYDDCELQYEAMYEVCYNSGDTDTFGWETDGWTDVGGEDSGVGFIWPSTSGWDTDISATGFWGSDTGGFGST